MFNSARLKLLAVFSVFALIGFGPLSPGCLIGMFIVISRPPWFKQLIDHLYDYPPYTPPPTSRSHFAPRLKTFTALLSLFIIDILPFPVTPCIAFIIILARPPWFHHLVAHIYA